MRRSDRQLIDPDRIASLLAQAQVCHLGFEDPQAGVPYLVPMNFGYVFDGGCLRLYFHCAPAGKKLQLMAQNPRVSFVVSQYLGLVAGPAACDYSARYFSLMGRGVLQRVEDEGERRLGLDALMRHCGAAAGLGYRPEVLQRTVVVRLEVEQYTAKGQLG